MSCNKHTTACHQCSPCASISAANTLRKTILEHCLRTLEIVARSHCREGEPGYDRLDVLAYCDAARVALAEEEA